MHKSFDKYELISTLYNRAEPKNLVVTPDEVKKHLVEIEDENGYASLGTFLGKELGFGVFSDRLFDTESYERRYGPIHEALSPR